MASGTYDIVTVGGGLGGSCLAKAMAEHGARVLVVERERQFRDRVRGEGMHAWGVPEARALGIYELLRETCGVEVRWWDTYLRSELIDHRDFPAATPHHSPLFGFYHLEMQEVLLTAATRAGAEVRRGASVREVKPGTPPTVVVEHSGQVEELRTEDEWQAFMADFDATLDRFDVPQTEREELIALVESTKGDIVVSPGAKP